MNSPGNIKPSELPPKVHSRPPACAWHFRQIELQTELITSVPLHIILNAPNSSNCSWDVAEIHKGKAGKLWGFWGFFFFFFWSLLSVESSRFWVMLFEELCCHLVYLSPNEHIANFSDNNKVDLHHFQKNHTQTPVTWKHLVLDFKIFQTINRH